MNHLQINNKIKFNPIFKKKNDIFYKNIQKIDQHFQIWFNPIYYLYELGNKNKQDFFWLESQKIDKFLSIKSKINNIYYNKYTLISYLQFTTIYKNFDYSKYKNILYIHNNNKAIDSKTNKQEIYDHVYKYTFFAHEFNYINTNIKYKYHVASFAELEQSTIKYDCIITFTIARHKVDLSLNQEIINSHNIIKTIISVLTHLKKGGSAIIYFTSFFENSTQQLILLLRNSFHSVSIFHQHFYNYSWANWVMCENFIQDNWSVELSKILKKYKNIDITELFDFNQLDNYEYELGSIYNLNTNIINYNKYYINPPKFNIYDYHYEIIKFYQNYNIVNINTFYINHLFKLSLNKMKITGIILIYNPDSNIIELFKKYNVVKYIYTKQHNILSKLLGYQCILLYNLNIDILFDRIFVYDFNSITELLELWNLLKTNSKLTFINCNNKNIDCFLTEISNNYTTEKYGINTTIIKTI